MKYDIARKCHYILFYILFIYIFDILFMFHDRQILQYDLPTMSILFNIFALFCTRSMICRNSSSLSLEAVCMSCTCLWQHAKPFYMRTCTAELSLDCFYQSILTAFIQILSIIYTAKGLLFCPAKKPILQLNGVYTPSINFIALSRAYLRAAYRNFVYSPQLLQHHTHKRQPIAMWI
jgi:hypothetical protein